MATNEPETAQVDATSQALAKRLGIQFLEAAAKETASQFVDKVGSLPLKVVGAAVDVGCQLTPLSLFNMGLGVLNLAAGVGSLGVGAFNAYQIRGLRGDVKGMQLQVGNVAQVCREVQDSVQQVAQGIGRVEQMGAGLASEMTAGFGGLSQQMGQGLERLGAHVDGGLQSMGVGLSSQMAQGIGLLSNQMAHETSDLSLQVEQGFENLAAQMGGLVIARGDRIELSVEHLKTQMEVRLENIKGALSWVGKSVVALADGQAELAVRLEALREEMRHGFAGVQQSMQSQAQLEFEERLGAVANRYTKALLELILSGDGQRCNDLKGHAQNLGDWVEPRLKKHVRGDPRRLPLFVALVYATIAEVDACLMAKMVATGMGSLRRPQGSNTPLAEGARQISRPADKTAQVEWAMCQHMLTNMVTKIEAEAQALVERHGVSAYAMAMDVAPVLSQYAVLHRAVRAKEGSGEPCAFVLSETALGGLSSQTKLAVEWVDGLGSMRLLCSDQAKENRQVAGQTAEWLELETAMDVLWLAKMLQEPIDAFRPGQARRVHQRSLLNSLGIDSQHVIGRLSHAGREALKELTLPGLREMVEGAINECFGRTTTRLRLPPWPQVDVGKVIKKDLEEQDKAERLAHQATAAKLARLEAEKERLAAELAKLEKTLDEERATRAHWSQVQPRVPPTAPMWACTATFTGHSDWVRSLEVSATGERVYSGSQDKTIMVWDTATGGCAATLEGHTDYVRAVVLSPDSGTVYSGSSDSTVRVWDTVSGECKATWEGHSNWVWALAVSPDGATLFSGSGDMTVKAWDVSRGVCTATLKGHSWSVAALAMSPDGRTVWSGSFDKSIKGWDTATGRCMATMTGHSDWVYSLAVSPDGGTVYSGSEDRTVKVWEVRTERCTATLTGHSGDVWAVAVSPDGRRVFSGSRDKTVKVWDVGSGTCTATLSGHGNWVCALVVSRDGRTLYSGSGDNTVKAWRIG